VEVANCGRLSGLRSSSAVFWEKVTPTFILFAASLAKETNCLRPSIWSLISLPEASRPVRCVLSWSMSFSMSGFTFCTRCKLLLAWEVTLLVSSTSLGSLRAWSTCLGRSCNMSSMLFRADCAIRSAASDWFVAFVVSGAWESYAVLCNVLLIRLFPSLFLRFICRTSSTLFLAFFRCGNSSCWAWSNVPRAFWSSWEERAADSCVRPFNPCDKSVAFFAAIPASFAAVRASWMAVSMLL